jgi:hypothetical protein
VSIAVALIVAASTWSARVAVGTELTLGLVFEVVASFGIAIAQYADPSRYDIRAAVAGLSGSRLDAGLHGDRAEPATQGARGGAALGELGPDS